MLASRFLRPASFATRTFARSTLRTAPPGTFVNTSRQSSSRAFSTTFERPRIPWQTTSRKSWRSQQQRGYARQAFNYQRFQASSSLFKRWAAHPNFYYHIAGIGGTLGGIYIYNLEEVPVSHRRRFNIVGPDLEQQTGQQMYQQTMQQYKDQILPTWHPKSRMVQRVLDRLIPHSGIEDAKWEVHVIEDEMKNAFVIPGGKVFVFSGILDVCQGDDGLAAVLGHEIAHNVAHHAAERMSQSGIFMAIAMLAAFTLGIDPGLGNFFIDLAFLRPGSRSQESEADYIGLLMMAESCYNPEAAMALWSRMEKEEQAAPPQFLSTHPSNHNRLEKIRTWLPEAEEKRESGGCGITAGYAGAFRDAWRQPR